MPIFVKMQNWIKWQTDSCSSVQNVQKIITGTVRADKGHERQKNYLHFCGFCPSIPERISV